MVVTGGPDGTIPQSPAVPAESPPDVSPSGGSGAVNDPERSGPVNAPAADRASRLSAAILRISRSLHLGTVLQEVVDSARALTGARQSVITTIDETGRLQDFVTSGLTPEERRELMDWPDGPWFFEHLRDRPEPLRVADLSGYLRSLGFSAVPWASRSLQGAPMHHRGEHLGTFFLGDKEDGEAFTLEDEEILVLFASQAATAIANARTHRDVERARANLEALVETSPVGVVVLDAATGRPVSLNREARRIAEEIRTPGCPAEQLVEVMTCRPRRRAGALARRASPGLPARGRHGGARRGDRAVGARRAERAHARQRHTHPLRRRRSRLGRRHDTGPRAARGTRAAAGRSFSRW